MSKKEVINVINVDREAELKNIFDDAENNRQADMNTVPSGQSEKPYKDAMLDKNIDMTRQLVEWIAMQVDKHGGKWTPKRTYINEQLDKVVSGWTIPHGHLININNDKDQERAMAQPNVNAVATLRATIKQFNDKLTAGNCTSKDYIRINKIEVKDVDKSEE